MIHEKKTDELRPEYRREDLGPGVRGKYLNAYQADTLIIPTEQVTEDNLQKDVDTGHPSGNEL